GSCFPRERCPRTAWPCPALFPPQAFLVVRGTPGQLRQRDELGELARLRATFRSRSSTSPHSGRSGVRQQNVRSDRRGSASTHPHPEQVVLDGSQRSESSTRALYQAVLERSCRLNS